MWTDDEELIQSGSRVTIVFKSKSILNQGSEISRWEKGRLIGLHGLISVFCVRDCYNIQLPNNMVLFSLSVFEQNMATTQFRVGVQNTTRPLGYKTFFMLNSAEHENFLLINVKMPTIVEK